MNKEKGFGLVGVLIAIGIIAVLGGSYYYSQQDESQTLEENDDSEIILNESENTGTSEQVPDTFNNVLDIMNFFKNNSYKNSSIEKSNLSWHFNKNDGDEFSEVVELKGLTMVFSTKKRSMSPEGFISSLSNSGDRTLGNSTGIRKDNLVCIIMGGLGDEHRVTCGDITNTNN
ncbi:MAG: prepilin-type N-terminal cleavage/methylation domain-containing protein [Patescibacteria group bacterium]